MKRITLLSVLLIVSLSTVGCATEAGTAPATHEAAGHQTEEATDSPMHTETPIDAMFIDSMVPHHQMAIDMSESALNHAEHEELREMAQQIIDAQQREIDMMHDWRAEWYPDLEATGGMHMEGMMSEEDMMMSTDESIPFDLRFIDAMIPHHQAAI